MNNFLLYIKSKDFRRQLILALAILLCLMLVVYVFLYYYTKHGTSQKVPLFKGLDITEALKKIDEHGFRYQLDSVYVQGKKPGLVVEQDPDAFTNVKPGRIIYLTITTQNTPKIRMPDIETLDLREAMAIIENNGLKLVDTIYKSDIAKDVVLEVRRGNRIESEQVTAGQLLAKGTGLLLVLGDGLGSNMVLVPNVMGMTINQAKNALRDASLTLGTIKYDGFSDSLKARVVEQKPLADSVKQVSIGTRVNLILED